MEAVWRAEAEAEADVGSEAGAGAGGVPVRHVLDALNARRPEPLAYTTVMTVMNRLVAKNVLTRHGERRGYVYEATAADVAGIAVRDVLRAHGDAAVARFVDEARADPGVLRRLRALLAQDEPAEGGIARDGLAEDRLPRGGLAEGGLPQDRLAEGR